MLTRTARKRRFRGCRQAADATPDRQAGAHPPHVRGPLSEGSDIDAGAPGQCATPRSLTAAIAAQLRMLPPTTRGIVEMLAVLNVRMPLAQLGQAAQVDSPSAAIESAVAARPGRLVTGRTKLPRRDPPTADPGRRLRRYHRQ